MRLRNVLGLDEAVAAAQAARAAALNEGWAVTIAIVDTAGVVVVLARMDDCTPLAVDTAVGKARSAAMTGLDTRMIEDMLIKRPGLATMGRVSVEGGLPILINAERVGGVGVSGVRSDQDASIAHIALTALLDAVTFEGR